MSLRALDADAWTRTRGRGRVDADATDAMILAGRGSGRDRVGKVSRPRPTTIFFRTQKIPMSDDTVKAEEKKNDFLWVN